MNRRSILSGMTAMSAGLFTPWESSAQDEPRLTGYIRTNWSEDPFSYGSYSYFAKGSNKKDVKALEKPIENRIFFAGEATYPNHNSTVHAAYESGQRVAGFVLDEDIKSVAIIGAGMSGLSAAHKLSKAGIDTTIFEARARIGGRIWTDKRLGAPVDLGASWIHGTKGNPLEKLSDEAGQTRIKTEDSYVIRNGNGENMDDDDAPDWLNDVIETQHTAAADADQINEWAYLWTGGYDGPDVKFPLGYADIFKALKGNYKVSLSSPISKVELLQNSVALTVNKDKVYDGFDAVIVTLPLGVLKRETVEFIPPLPERKIEAINQLGMGVLDKLYLQFDEAFWGKEASWVITPENGLPPGQFNQWLNLYKYLNQPILLAFNGGTPALDLAKLTDEELVKRALQTLRLAYSE